MLFTCESMAFKKNRYNFLHFWMNLVLILTYTISDSIRFRFFGLVSGSISIQYSIRSFLCVWISLPMNHFQSIDSTLFWILMVKTRFTTSALSTCITYTKQIAHSLLNLHLSYELFAQIYLLKMQDLIHLFTCIYEVYM